MIQQSENIEVAILEFIKTIRESFDYSIEVYTDGGCYRFYKILKSVFPSAEAYYDVHHVITKIGGKYYDINGEWTDLKNYLPLSEYNLSEEEVESWKYEN